MLKKRLPSVDLLTVDDIMEGMFVFNTQSMNITIKWKTCEKFLHLQKQFWWLKSYKLKLTKKEKDKLKLTQRLASQVNVPCFIDQSTINWPHVDLVALYLTSPHFPKPVC